jgi:protein gp37
LRLVPEKLVEPLKWSSPKTVFVNSMSDLFHEEVPDAYIEQVVRVMEMADWHTYQVLTKRAERLREMLSGPLGFATELKHIWWGVSVENRKHGLPRIDHLRRTPADIRFLSIEPLLEDLGAIDLGGIDWVIVGGESGWGARAMDPEWVISIRDQCQAIEVPFFFKQWGGRQKSKHGRHLEGRTYDDMPKRNPRSAPSRSSRMEMIDRLAAGGRAQHRVLAQAVR